MDLIGQSETKSALTPEVKPWVMQSFQTFDSMDRTPRYDHSLGSSTAVLFDPLNPRMKPWVIQSFLTFDSMDRTLHWKVVEQYFTVKLF